MPGAKEPFDRLSPLYYNWSNTSPMENIPWHLDEDLNSRPMTEKAPAVKTMKSCSWKRVDALDRRLDNIDSMVTAVAERVMNRPLVIVATCPHCGKNMEIALMGTQKPAK